MDRRSARTPAVWIAMLAVLLLAFGLLAGCGGSSSPGTTSGAAGNPLQVIMTNLSYQPPQITVKVGETVTWVNEDGPQHDVVANGGEFKSGLLDKGGTFSFTLAKAGTYKYYCSIHPNMVGTVVVQ